MIASVQRDGFGDYPYVAFEVVESGVHAVETFAQQSFDRWCGVQKMLKSSFDEHALANTRSVACDVEPTANTLTQPNRYFAAFRGFLPAVWSNVNEIGLRPGQLLHVLIVPQGTTIEAAASRQDEVNQHDGNYRKNRLSIASTMQMCLPYAGVEKERRCGIAQSGLT